MRNSKRKSKEVNSDDEKENRELYCAPNFMQAKHEIKNSLKPLFEQDEKYQRIFDYIVEPENIYQFKVVWEDDEGKNHVEKGYRIHFSSVLGPCKGGLRFDKAVTEDTFKFLALEQTLKNALTGANIGGGKGGSTFNPKGKSRNEIIRFCIAFMQKLIKVIGPNVDVPAGDIGVNSETIGYLFGAYRQLGGKYEPGVLTGKSIELGGSLLRPEATGYGVIYGVNAALKENNDEIKGKTILISGTGNVASHCAFKAIELGAKVLTLSDRNGTYFNKDGFTADQIKNILKLKKQNKIDSLKDKQIEVIKDKKPWQAKKDVKADICLPCATQNEINDEDAKILVEKRKIQILSEGSNMSSTNDAIEIYKKNKITYLPAKFSNSGGVYVSSLEMDQNASKQYFTSEEVDKKLKDNMERMYENASESAKKYKVNFADGVNIVSFLRVAEAIEQLGYI